MVEVVGERETRKIDKDTIEITIRGRAIALNIPKQYQPDYDIDAEVRLSSPSIMFILIIDQWEISIFVDTGRSLVNYQNKHY